MALAVPVLMKVAMAATAASSVVSAVGAIQQGRAAAKQATFEGDEAQRQATFEAGEMKREAQYNSNNAARTAEDAETNFDLLLRQRDRALGAQRVAVGRSGITFSGSAVDVYRDTALEAEREASRTLFNGLTNSGNQRGAADSNMRSAGNTLLTGRNASAAAGSRARSARTGSYFSAAGSLLSGAAGVARIASYPSIS